MKVLLPLILFFSFIAFSQNPGEKSVDSMLKVLPTIKDDVLKVNLYNELSYFYKKKDAKNAEHYALKALTLAHKIDYNDGAAIAYSRLGAIYFKKLNLAKALYYFDKTLKSTSNKNIVSKALASKGDVYITKSNYTKALDLNNQSLKICEETGDEQGAALALSNIGKIYYNLLQYNRAIVLFQKALKINLEKNVFIETGNTYYWLGNTYANLKQYEKAENYYNKAVDYSEKAHANFNKTLALGELTEVYFTDGKYDQALNAAKQLQELENQLGFGASNSFCMGISGKIYLQKAQETNDKIQKKNYFNAALKYANESLVTDKALGNTKEIAEDYQLISEIQALMGNFSLALTNYQTAIIYKDSVFNSDNKETIRNLEDKRTIELRNKEIKISRLTLKSKEKQKWYLLFGIGLLGIIGSLLFYQSLTRKKNNQKLNLMNVNLNEANNVKTRLLGILNHDLRSPVNSFIHFIQLQKESPELLDKTTKTRIEDGTIASAKNLLNSMEDILLWTKDHMENFEPQFKNVFISVLFKDTKNHFSAEDNVKISFECLDNMQFSTDDNYVKAILRNLTANAINAAKETSNPIVILKAWRENNENYISVSDNGKGASEQRFRSLYDDKQIASVQSGLGLHLIRDLAKAIGCVIVVKSEPNNGTTFVLQFNQ